MASVSLESPGALPNAAGIKSGGLSCKLCSRVFSRAEHLDRHRQAHQSHLKCFVCHLCSKAFTRKDVLTRHVRAVHEAPSTPRRSRKKSCVRCARCSGGSTCEACGKRDLQCVYEFRRVSGFANRSGTAEDEEEKSEESEGESEADSSRKRIKTNPEINVQQPTPIQPLNPLPPLYHTSMYQSIPPTSVAALPPTDKFNQVFPLPPLPEPKTNVTSMPSPLSQLVADDNLENWLFDPGVFELDWLRAELGVRDLYDASKAATSASPPSMNSADRKPASELTAPIAIPTPPLSSQPQLNTPPHPSQPQSMTKTFYYDNSRHAQTRQLLQPQYPSPSPISPQPYTNPGVASPPLSSAPTAPQQQPQQRSSSGVYKASLSPLHWHRDQSVTALGTNTSFNLPPPVPFNSLVTRRGHEQDLEPSNSDIWPFAPRMCPSRAELSVKLPPLSQVLGQTTASAPESREGIGEKVRNEMISLLELPYERHPYAEVDISKFPDGYTLDVFLRSYFENLHPIVPVIHRPTFRIATCPAILLATMISIGASYADMDGAHQFADTLSELCKRTLQWMGNYDSNYARSGYFVTAFCLQNVYALGSGDKRLYEEADESRSYLVSSARSMGLFSPPPTDMVLSLRGNETDQELEKLWHAWRDEEMGKRLAWSVFEYDCAISTLSARRGCIALNDLRMDMPGEERLWEAPTAREWAAYAFLGGRGTLSRGLSFYPTLRDLMSGVISPDQMPNWGKRLCAQAIGRILWDFRELEDSALSNILLAPTDYSPAKETLLRALMYLHDSMTSPYNILDMVHMNMTCLIAHYSHLYTAREIMDLVIALARTRKADRVDAMHRIQVVFTLDPVNTRKLAWHAAQIIGIARQYPIRTPCETMRVFLAGLFLYAFAKYSQPSGATALSVKLDALSWLRKGSQPQDLEQWFLQGGRASMDNVDDICARKYASGTEIATGADQVLAIVLATLRSMKSWGVAAKFCSVLIYVHRRDAVSV